MHFDRSTLLSIMHNTIENCGLEGIYLKNSISSLISGNSIQMVTLQLRCILSSNNATVNKGNILVQINDAMYIEDATFPFMLGKHNKVISYRYLFTSSLINLHSEITPLATWQQMEFSQGRALRLGVPLTWQAIQRRMDRRRRRRRTLKGQPRIQT